MLSKPLGLCGIAGLYQVRKLRPRFLCSWPGHAVFLWCHLLNQISGQCITKRPGYVMEERGGQGYRSLGFPLRRLGAIPAVPLEFPWDHDINPLSFSCHTQLGTQDVWDKESGNDFQAEKCCACIPWGIQKFCLVPVFSQQKACAWWQSVVWRCIFSVFWAPVCPHLCWVPR